MMRRPRLENPRHLDRIRQLPCLVCLDNTSTEAAHIRFSDARVAKVNPGSHKPDDRWTVPLCHSCHLGQDGQHQNNERIWWREKVGIDPILIALALYAARDHDEAEHIIRAQHPVTNNLMAG